MSISDVSGILSEQFVRVIHPIDPWREFHSEIECIQDFQGKGECISVAMIERCNQLAILAAFHGARREVGLSEPAVFHFMRSEIIEDGAELKDTDANPPWPPEYNHAHHDIAGAKADVAASMVRRFQADTGRISVVHETLVAVAIAQLLHREDVHSRFQKNDTWRMRRLFQDGGHFRQVWIQVAKQVPAVLADEVIKTEFRRLWNQNRAEWDRLSLELPCITVDVGYR
jgi:hypothetical protein